MNGYVSEDAAPDERRERRREGNRRWREANRDKKRDQDRAYRERNREQIRERQREQSRRWNEANRDKRREQSRRWNAANPDRMRENTRRWRLANPEKIRQKKRRWSHGPDGEEWRLFQLSAQGGNCAYCQSPVPPEGSVIDHDHSCWPPGRSCSMCRRAVCCQRCNLLVGLALDDPERLLAVARNFTTAFDQTRARMAAREQLA